MWHMQDFKDNEKTAQKKENERNICFKITFVKQFYKENEYTTKIKN